VQILIFNDILTVGPECNLDLVMEDIRRAAGPSYARTRNLFKAARFRAYRIALPGLARCALPASQQLGC
jgi:hypothetical protein